MKSNDIDLLNKVMDSQGVINKDIGVINKINSALKCKKVFDGHAFSLFIPHLTFKYVSLGMSAVIP
ncbi:hypothetical protein QIA37_05060 (plasmid) [Borrelia sp. CA_690]|uniref:Uncharacterized protein n=1 Tax=Borrelia maritima TaxID=2761123 RepID=A0A5J6WBG5_9SPIR|nr:hypothetical protein [Borrelia maritima]QFI15024.1 hypothetical protein DB723_04750 [Borrelia maritima]